MSIRPMNILPAVALLLFLTLPLAQARIWTDVKGRTIEADIVRVDGEVIIVKKAGKDVRLPLYLLCAEDKEFVERWQEEGEDANDDAKPAASGGGGAAAVGNLSLGGEAVEPGGKMTLIEKPLSAESMKALSKDKDNKVTSFKLAVSVPEGFDPAVPQKYFIAVTAVNNAAEGARGNVGVFKGYSKVCSEQGWACLAIDSNEGYTDSVDVVGEAIALLEAEWAGFRGSTFASGGFSGGSKGCWWHAAYLVKNDFKVAGVYMIGCNEDYSEKYKAILKPSSSDYKKIRGYVCSGKNDKIATPAQGESVMASLKANGFRDLRSVLHEGGHNQSAENFAEALKWFVEP